MGLLYISVVPTPALETDTQSKRWADYLGKTNSEDSVARFFGQSGLEADGFRQKRQCLAARLKVRRGLDFLPTWPPAGALRIDRLSVAARLSVASEVSPRLDWGLRNSSEAHSSTARVRLPLAPMSEFVRRSDDTWVEQDEYRCSLIGHNLFGSSGFRISGFNRVLVVVLRTH